MSREYIDGMVMGAIIYAFVGGLIQFIELMWDCQERQERRGPRK